MMTATCKPGDGVILPRTCHQSLINACAIVGTIPIFITPVTTTTTAHVQSQEPADDLFGLSHGIEVDSLSACISQVKSSSLHVGLVVLVSPTYFGATTDVAAAALICHKHGIPLGVDAAHGAHFRFSKALPQCALEAGADIVVESTHKTLSAMTQVKS